MIVQPERLSIKTLCFVFSFHQTISKHVIFLGPVIINIDISKSLNNILEKHLIEQLSQTFAATYFQFPTSFQQAIV